MKDFNIGSEKMTRNGLKVAISYFCDIWIETDYSWNCQLMGFWPARTLCSVVCEGHVRLLSLSPLSFLPPLRKLQIWLLSSLLRCWNIFFISFVCTLVTWGIPICRCVCFSWTPCSLLLEPYLKCVIFFSPNKRKEIVGICTKMFDFSFFYW